jgi:sarcosine oxidase
VRHCVSETEAGDLLAVTRFPGSNRLTDVLVIGGGVNGLAAAWHLTRRGARVALVERFRVGHDRGSSHGASRIARSAYPEAGYVRLMRRAFAEEWPRLERDAGRTLLHRTPAYFFGPPGGSLGAYARAVREAGADVLAVPPAEARKLAPQFRFEGCDDVLVDRTAGLVAAADTVASLAALVRAAGAEVSEATAVRAVEPHADRVEVATDRGVRRADRVIVTAGAWTSRLVPRLAPRLAVARQSIGYFAIEGGADAARLGRFPVWCQMGATVNDFHYGLPSFGREGIKAAQHVTSQRDEDPDVLPAGPDERSLADLRAFLDRELAVRIERRVGAETCLYTNTPTEDFVIGPLPGEPRIVVGSACSGHAFKFAPLTGRALAELALDGRTSMPEFEAMRATFAV